MKAAVVHDFHPPLQVEDVPTPVPGPGEVLVKVETSGCATPTSTPRTATGRSSRLRRSFPVTRASGSSRRSAPASARRRSATGSPCRGSARPAGSATTASTGGRPCVRSRSTPGTSTARTPSTPPRTRPTSRWSPTRWTRCDAAVLTCAGVTTYKAVKVSGARRGDWSRFSASADSATLPCSTRRSAAPPSSRSTSPTRSSQLATELGADHVVNALTEDPVKAIQDLGGAHAAIALAASPEAFEQAFTALRRGGTLVFVALPADNHVDLPIFETVLRGITVCGSIVGTRKDLAEVYAIHAAGPYQGDPRGPQARRGQRVLRRRPRRPGPSPYRLPVLMAARQRELWVEPFSHGDLPG